MVLPFFSILAVPAAMILSWTPTLPVQKFPTVSFEVAFRQKEDGKLGKGLHFVDVVCVPAGCELTFLSLNQCGRSGSGRDAFAPGVERKSTFDGTLEVEYLGKPMTDNHETIVFKYPVSRLGSGSAVLRFVYQKRKSSSFGAKVTGFSGGFTKSSDILGRVVQAEYVALPDEWNYIELDCEVLLPGLSKRKE